jgi:hypothetical protein
MVLETMVTIEEVEEVEEVAAVVAASQVLKSTALEVVL